MESALASRWAEEGVRVVAWCGVDVPANFGAPEDEVRAFGESAALVDRTANEVVSVHGSDARDFVHRLTTQEIRSAAVGTAIQAAFVTSKGRLLHVADAWISDDEIVLVGRRPADGGIRSLLEKFHFSESLEIVDASDRFRAVSIHGPSAKSVIEGVFGVSVPDDRGFAIAGEHEAIRILRTAPVGGVGFHVLIPASDVAAVFDRLREGGASPAGQEAFDRVRIEQGIPGSPGEVDERFNPHEVGLREFLRLDKGCYVGQEVLARLETYDKVSRRLVRLEITEVSGNGPSVGSDLVLEDRVVGVVTSVAAGSQGGEARALGVVKRDFLAADTTFRIVPEGTEDRSGLARVVGLGGEPAPSSSS